MIKISRKEDCCGCAVCADICPKNCITMKPDEKGFLYPEADAEKCIECHMCERACPVSEPLRPEYKPVMYALQNSDERVRMESTSGGAFTLIAEWVLDRGGSVIGAAFDDKFLVLHRMEDSWEGIADFRGSKYVQSSTEGIYRTAEEELKKGRWVCFSGTPCQINGLKKFLRKEYEKLVTADLACHGVTSPLFFKKYLDYHREKAGADITSVLFREKYYGYGFSTMKIGFSDGSCYRAGMETDLLLRSFFLDLNTRESCHACRFKTVDHVSDFTLFDGWHVGKYRKDMEDDRGTTLCIVQSEKGARIFDEIRSRCTYAEVPVERGVALDGSMLVKSTTANPRREEFFADIRKMSVPEIQKKYYPVTVKRKVLSVIKPAVYKMGLFKLYMKMKEKAGKK